MNWKLVIRYAILSVLILVARIYAIKWFAGLLLPDEFELFEFCKLMISIMQYGTYGYFIVMVLADRYFIDEDQIE